MASVSTALVALQSPAPQKKSAISVRILTIAGCLKAVGGVKAQCWTDAGLGYSSGFTGKALEVQY